MPLHYLQKGMDWRFGETGHDSINPDRSFRSGRSVYYNPGNRGQYTDGQDALNDVPPGGTFILSAGTDYDVATEGRLILDTGKTIRGEGWTADETRTMQGSKIVNSGADAIDQPVIEYQGTERDHRGITLRDLQIIHTGSTSPAVYINNSIRNLIADCKLSMEFSGQKGIETEGQAFFTRIVRTHVERFTQYGLHLKGSMGGGGCVLDSHVGSSVTDSVATRVERPGIRITGGQHSSNGAGISFYNPTNVNMGGSYVDGHIWFEACQDGIRIDGDTNPYEDVTIVNPRAHLDYVSGSGVQNLVKMGLTNNSIVLYPMIKRINSGGNLATIGANTVRPKFVGDYSNVGAAPIVDNGASLPIKIVQDAVTDGYLRNIITSIPVWVALRRGVNGEWSPAFYDTGAGSWYHQASANTPFVP